MIRRYLVAAVAAVMLFGSGVAAAVIAPAGAASSGPVLYGCVATSGSGTTLRHVWNVHQDAPGTTCPAGSFEISWQGLALPGPTPSPSPTSSSPPPSPSPSPSSTSSSPPPAGQCPTSAPLYELTTLDHAQTPQMPAISAGSNDGGAAVRQEVWNPSPELTKQDTQVWSPSSWCTTINAAAGNTAVNSYPDVSDTVTDVTNNPVPIDNYAQLATTYSEQMHATAGTDAEAAYDIWLGTPGSGYNFELMIWVDNHGQRPIGTDIGQVTLGGVTYDEWLGSTAKPNPSGSTISLVQANAQSGSADILAIVDGLRAQGYYPANVGVNQIDFGFETPSTGGQDEVFEVDNYTLTAVAAPGKTV